MKDELKQLHEVELEILDEFDRICRKNNLQYFLDSGSALGAIRHQGFIPWDDDVDVGMLRDDYTVFCNLAESELQGKFCLQNLGTDPYFYKFSSKIRKRNTFFPEYGDASLLKERGIFIDVYPFDYISDIKIFAKIHLFINRRIVRLFRFRQRNLSDCSGIKNVLRRIIEHVPLYVFARIYENNCTRHYKSHSITCFSYRMSADKDLVFNYSDMMPTKDVNFEQRKYRIMQNPDSYLKTMYGDYMTLPPEDKRVYHHKGNIVFTMGNNENENY